MTQSIISFMNFYWVNSNLDAVHRQFQSSKSLLFLLTKNPSQTQNFHYFPVINSKHSVVVMEIIILGKLAGIHDNGATRESSQIIYGKQWFDQHYPRTYILSNFSCNLLDLFVITHQEDHYNTSISTPLGYPDHALSSVFTSGDAHMLGSNLAWQLWHYNSANWHRLRDFSFSTSWSAVCFSSTNPPVIDQKIAKVIQIDIETLVPNSSQKKKKSQFPEPTITIESEKNVGSSNVLNFALLKIISYL